MEEFDGFTALAKRYTNGKDHRIVQKDRGGKFLILAPHGGGIEPGTSELAKAIAGEDLSLNLFEGVRSSKNEVLHLTSIHFDEPQCVNLIQKFPKAIAIHGCNDQESVIYVGGLDPDLRNKFVEDLSAKGYLIKISSEGLAGVFPTNICNRTQTGRGVQLEFSIGIRREFFKNWRTRIGRRTTTQAMQNIVADIRSIIMDEGKDGHVPTNSNMG